MDSKALQSQKFSTRIIANVATLCSRAATRKQEKQLQTLMDLNQMTRLRGFERREYTRLLNRDRVVQR